jgi:hypothetical protein
MRNICYRAGSSQEVEDQESTFLTGGPGGPVDTKPVETGVVHVPVVGVDIKLNVGEEFIRGLFHVEELEGKASPLLAVGVAAQPDRLRVLLRPQTEHNEVPRGAVDSPRRRHALRNVLHGEAGRLYRLRQLDDDITGGTLQCSRLIYRI